MSMPITATANIMTKLANTGWRLSNDVFFVRFSHTQCEGMFSDFKVNQNLRHIGGLGRLILRNDRFDYFSECGFTMVQTSPVANLWPSSIFGQWLPMANVDQGLFKMEDGILALLQMEERWSY